MRHALLAITRDAGRVTASLRHRLTRRLAHEAAPHVLWHDGESFAAATWGAGGLPPSRWGTSLIQRPPLVAIGDVRLDNRTEVASWSNGSPDHATDLELVAAALAHRGPGCLPALLGDFAFAICDLDQHSVIAACDPFGVKTLYYATSADHAVFSSTASAIGDDKYDLDFIADFLACGAASPASTIYESVHTVAPGTIVTLRRGAPPAAHTYWRAQDYCADGVTREADPAGAFRELFGAAVERRLSDAHRAWVLLSGGVDSSSIACMAHTLKTTGALRSSVVGTLTMADSLGEGDEMPFVEAVVRHCGVPSCVIHDAGPWDDDGTPPPRTDQPDPGYPYYALHRRARRLVHEQDGDVVLTGIGADQYLYGNLYYIADWLRRGRVVAALRETAERAMLKRASFWTELLDNVVRPLAPRWTRPYMLRGTAALAPWYAPSFVRRYGLRLRVPDVRVSDTPAPTYFDAERVFQIANVSRCIDRSFMSVAFDVRYPFLYRPLVELCLRLPPRDIVGSPTTPANKAVLRQAMSGILPDEVRLRRSKGGIGGRLSWSYAHHADVLRALLKEPILGDLGCIDVAKLRAGFAAAQRGDRVAGLALYLPLALESWLAVRSGRWTARGTYEEGFSSFTEQTTHISSSAR